jgi:hypothetical protein
MRTALKVAQHHQGQHERQHCTESSDDFRCPLPATREEKRDDNGAQERQIGDKRQNVSRSRRVLKNLLRMREYVLHGQTPFFLVPSKAAGSLTQVKMR